MRQEPAQPRVHAPTGQPGARPKLEGGFSRMNGHAEAAFERVGTPGGLLGRLPEDALARAIGDMPGMSFGSNGLSVFMPVRGGATELTNPYRENWTIYACCQAWAQAVGSVPLFVNVSEDPEAEVLPPEHEVMRLLAMPCPWATGMQQRMASVINRKLTGEDIWFLCDQKGEPITTGPALAIDLPKSIISASGFRVSDLRDESGLIKEWTYGTSSGESPKFPASSVLHFADYNPEDPQRGLGAAQVAMRQLGVVFQAERHQESVYRSGGPGYWLMNKQLVEEPQAKREQAELEERLDNSDVSKPRILRGDWTVAPVPGAPKDLGVFESMAWSRNVICSIFGVPPPVIGILEDAKYANMAEAWRQFWIAVAGYLRGIEDVLNSQFFPRLKDQALAKCRARFDLSGVDALREDMSKQQELALKIAQAGVGLSMAGASTFVELEYDDTIEGIDTRVIASALIPLDEETAAAVLASKPPPPPPVAPPAGAPEGKAKLLVMPPVVTAADRRRYAANYHLRVLMLGDLRLYGRVYHFLAQYERAAIAKLASVAGMPVPQPTDSAKALQRSSVAELEELLLLSEKKWAEIFRTTLGGSVDAIYQHALADMAAEIGTLQLPMTDPRIQRLLAEQLTKLTEGVNSTLATKVKEALIRVLGEPSSITDLRQAVQAELPALTEELRRVFGTKGARALTIARTETGHASANARVTQMKEAGIDEIEWASAEDDAVRESHQQLDGQHRTLGEEFKSNLRWPHDANGPAGEVINCRCVARPIVKV